MKHFLNLFAAVVLCSWTADCQFNSNDDDGGSTGDIIINDSSSRSSGSSREAAGTGLYEQAVRISNANKARWEEYAKNMTAAERSAKYPAFVAENPVDVNLIYERLKKEAQSQDKDQT